MLLVSCRWWSVVLLWAAVDAGRRRRSDFIKQGAHRAEFPTGSDRRCGAASPFPVVPGVVLATVLGKVMAVVKGGPQKMQEMAMQQMMKQMMKQMGAPPGQRNRRSP